MIQIFIDADGCPVKNEVYRVAKRYGVAVKVVANAHMHVPDDAGVEFVKVNDDFDAADDWIAGECGVDDIVITTDIPLASRCLANGARVIGPKGRVFTEEGIGDALASREIASHLREHGVMSGGPAPFGKQDRSRFLQALDTAVVAAMRGR